MIKGSASMILTRFFGQIYQPIQNKKSPDWSFNDEPPKRLQQTGAFLMCSSTFFSYLTKVGRIKTNILHVEK